MAGVNEAASNYRWRALVAVSVGVWMSTIDVGAVGVSLPSVLTDLDTSLEVIQWAVLAYFIAVSSLLVVFGKAADRYGRKRVLITGLVVFVIGNVLSGSAQEPVQLIAGRAISGIGNAMIQANGQAVVAQAFAGRDLGKGLGIYATSVASGLALGPAVGGILTDALGWQAVFFAAAPIGALAILMTARILEPDRPMTGIKERFDVAGTALWICFLITLMLALTRGSAWGWTSLHTLGLMAVSLIAAAAFAAVELSSSFPTLDLRLFRIPAFASGCAASLASFLAQQSNLFLTPFYLQFVLAVSPRTAGLLMTPTFIGMALLSPLSGRLADVMGGRQLAALGLALLGGGLAILAWVSSADGSYIVIALTLLALGAGHGFFQPSNNKVLYDSLAPSEYGVGAGSLATTRNLGGAVGVALWGAVTTSLLSARGFDGPLSDAATDNRLAEQILPAFLDAFHLSLILAAVVALIGVAVTLAPKGTKSLPEATDSGI